MADFTRADVAHLLRRAGFGGSAAQITTLMAQPSWAAVVDRVLDTSANPADTVPAAVDSRDDEWYGAWVAGVQYWMDRMATSPTPIVEKMALFWHGNLASSTEVVLPRQVFRQVKTYRALGLGDVHALMQAMAIEPAMLLYLNNADNVAAEPNENFARELMELFTVGVGHYTEADVVAMAKAWTGHNTVGWDNVAQRYDTTYKFWSTRHDTTNKSLFGGATSPIYGAQPRNWNALETIEELVFGLKQADTARYVARKMYKYFIAEAVNETSVQQIANAWIAGGMQISALVQATLLHDDFWSPANRFAIVRSPVEWVVATLRTTGYRFSANSAEGRSIIEGMGQVPFDPPNVAGWKMNAYWLSTATAWARGGFASWLRWKVADDGALAALLPTLKTGGNGRVALTATQAVDTIFETLWVNQPANSLAEVSNATRARLQAWYDSANTSGNAWSIRGTALMLGLLSPDFQLA